MADVTLADAIAQSRDNLIILAKLALTDVSKVLDYTTALDNTANIFTLLISSYRRQPGLIKTGSAQDTQTFTFAADLVLHVNQWLAGFDGQTYEQAAWVYLPTAAQYFEQHRGLTTQTLPRVPYLDVDNTCVTNAVIRPAVTSSGGTELTVVFTWSLVYNTVFLRLGQ